MFLDPNKMKKSHYFSVFDTLWNLGLFNFRRAPPNFEIFPTETWDFFDFLTTPPPSFWTIGQIFHKGPMKFFLLEVQNKFVLKCFKPSFFSSLPWWKIEKIADNKTEVKGYIHVLWCMLNFWGFSQKKNFGTTR